MQRTAQVVALQNKIENIRNIAIIAHVDHGWLSALTQGKTTLSDSLLASNGIISQKLAGKVRYLDSREDEQERGITMEASGISLFFSRLCNLDAVPEKTDYLINLIDSPGHVDFSCEVSTASRLCDGGLLLVDAVEGVCAQTHTVLRQAVRERVRPILVLNKIDRLILEWKQTPLEAFIHLSKILEQVNAILGEYEARELLQEAEVAAEEPLDDHESDMTQEEGDKEREEYYFAPEKGNVIFASAIDGWAFRTSDFARLYASKLGVNEHTLNKYMWGKYYLDPKTKRVVGPRGLKGRNLKPLFVQFALDNLFRVYDTVLHQSDPAQVEKIITSLGVKVAPREIKTKEVRTLLQSIMSQWLPLAAAVLVAVVQKIPNPREAQAYRMDPIIIPSPEDPPEKQLTDRAIVSCDTSLSAPVAAFLSKIFSVSAKELPASVEEKKKTAQAQAEARQLAIARSKARAALRAGEDSVDVESIAAKAEALALASQQADAGDDKVFIGFARIYSGIIKVGQTIQILGPKFSLASPERHLHQFEMVVERLFLLMGKDLQDLDQVPAGNVFGILVRNENILKTATLSSTIYCSSLAGMKLEAPPILRVALEPSDPTQLKQLVSGLKLLDRADPAVQVDFEDTGENVIVCAGELHLEIGIEASEPLVPYRETIIALPSLQSQKDSNVLLATLGTVEKTTPNLRFALRVIPLPAPLRTHLLKTSDEIARIASFKSEEQQQAETQRFLAEMKHQISEAKKDGKCPDVGADWTSLLDKIVSFGPKNTGPNLLVNCLSTTEMQLWADPLDKLAGRDTVKGFEYQASIAAGFQLGTAAGPLCAEAIAGVAVLLERFEIVQEDSDLSFLPGQVLSLVKESIKTGFLQWSPRLMLAMYTCDLQTEAQFLGKVDGVLSRRRGKILSEDIKDGTTLFTLEASLPVVESFGFVDGTPEWLTVDLRKKTSGVASPQLVFSGFELLDIDPFWVPTTEEELEDHGAIADRENLAKMYMEKVRIRKGLAIEKKLVEHGDKQRNMKNK
ncbi:Cytoplasmic GTPase/eEF2-like protein (ribosomal biogenesis) [Kappamyces sp. JEL0680]|nr:Cytoplasmic GTPase/eEF2-like protein (ribosomal biogenesis) [Kappamyces sp. JEL0680]